MGKLVPTIAKAGSTSGLQEEPVLRPEPLSSELDLTSYVNKVGRRSNIELLVQGVHCAGCVSKIETGLRTLPGVDDVRMNLSTSRLYISWAAGKQNVQNILQKLSGLGFAASPYSVDQTEEEHKQNLRFLLKCLAVAGFATMNIMLLSVSVWSGGADMTASTRTLFHIVSAAIAIPAIAYAARPFFTSAWSSVRAGSTNMDVPISLAICLAVGLSLYETIKGYPDTYFDAAIMLVFLLLIGRYLDARMRARTGMAARRLAAMQVSTATRIRPDGRNETLPARDIHVGDLILVRVGQRIPLDGKVEEGRSDIDVQIITGESRPQAVSAGDEVYSGTLNLTAPLKIRAIATHQNSFLSEITRLIETGEQSKSGFVQIADRAARIYVPVVHTLALLTLIGWLIAGGDMRQALICAIAVLIITCPCALGLAVPAVNVVTVGELYRRGVLVKSGDVLERLSKVNMSIFDKTGTLTQGMPSLVEPESLDPVLLSQAAALARHSSHPLSRALAKFDEGLIVSNISEQVGAGLCGEVDGIGTRLGSAAFMGAPQSEDDAMQVWAQVGDAAPIVMRFEDTLRPEAKDVIERLRSLGLQSQMISGDQLAVTERLAREVGISDFQAGVSPSEKLNLIDELTQQGHRPLMIGDGVNDAPALAGATASVSLSSASDVSRDTADIILQHNGLTALPEAIAFARRSQARIRENLSLAVIYNALAVPLAVFGHVTPLIAAAAMSGSSLLVTANALRMRRL